MHLILWKLDVPGKRDAGRGEVGVDEHMESTLSESGEEEDGIKNLGKGNSGRG